MTFFLLGSVEILVIQANERLSFEDDLRSGGLLYCDADSMVTLGEPRDGYWLGVGERNI